MRLIVIRDVGDRHRSGSALRRCLSMSPLAGALLSGTQHLWVGGRETSGSRPAGWARSHASVWVIPQEWRTPWPAHGDRIVYHGGAESRLDAFRACNGHWGVVSNGRFPTSLNGGLLQETLARSQADIVAVTASRDLLAYRERVRLKPDGCLAGLRRCYADSVAPTPMPDDWPHHLFLRRAALDTVADADLTSPFSEFLTRCRDARLHIEAVSIAGASYDLERPEDILALCEFALCGPNGIARGRGPAQAAGREGVSPQARVIGPVLLGDRVVVEAEATIVGPAVLCEGSRVERGALVDTCILGEGVSVEPGGALRRDVLLESNGQPDRPGRAPTARRNSPYASRPAFRTWPRLSYPGWIKRGLDIVAALVVLVLFLPILPLLALAVKVSSPGPIFFKHRRQGLHGKTFGCIKFRTMKAGADAIQDKLRFVCEVDGPQFKMADDPRITGVGRFLRDTYLDEIPQFFNVLCGQMSVVGPRPSPESENTLCPPWRDARLSVRPGITGLWQVCRTREPFKDFQEWIHYDMHYVRELSARLDLWICWRTFRRMVHTFVSQF